MKYIKIDVTTTTQVEELLAYNLNERGIEGVEIINNMGISDEDKKAMFIDIIPDYNNDNTSILRFFIKEDDDVEKYKNIVIQEVDKLRDFFDVGNIQINTSQADDSEWKDRWKEYFKPFNIDDIYITPTWINEKTDASYIIKIDPGCAFGTGLHETTRLCVRQLRKLINNDINLLDIGCGSAILSIVACKLGAKEVCAINIDENALKVAKENFEINNISNNKYSLYSGNIIDDLNIDSKLGYGKYEIVVANLLAEIIVEMADRFLPHIKNGGCLITSGILRTKENMVTQKLKEVGFLTFESEYDGDWVSIVARR